MLKEKVLPFVKARRELSAILDQVSNGGRAVIIAKRQKPVAAIVGMREYHEMAGARKYLREVRGRRILKVRGIASLTGDVDQAIKTLRKSRIDALTRSL
ncbi:MAG: type II toxin-antitoxin system Phd/YefM family antitoxin [Deltaproteobacteria bacterium]|nr:type II toxin-antitoxin system Phd/YefM family antitoxin [Deltaproteobacteria bacterium]